MDLGLRDKVAIVTGGASGGLGEAMAARLLEEGCRVVVADRNAERNARPRRAARAARRGARPRLATSRRPTSPSRSRRLRARRFGGVDVVVNNAGDLPVAARGTSTRVEEWDTTHRHEPALALADGEGHGPVDARARRRLDRQHRLDHRADRDARTSCPYVVVQGRPDRIDACARARGREAHNVRVNNVSPGAFPTGGETIHPDPEGYSRFVIEQQCLKRRGTPDDLADVVAFMASERSSLHHRPDDRGLRRLGARVSSLFGAPAHARRAAPSLRHRAEQVAGAELVVRDDGARAGRARRARALGRDRGRRRRRPRARPRGRERARHARVLDLAHRTWPIRARRSARLGPVPHLLRRAAHDLRPRAHARPGGGRAAPPSTIPGRRRTIVPAARPRCRRRRRGCPATASTGTPTSRRCSCAATCARPTCSARRSRSSARSASPLGGATVRRTRCRAQRRLRADAAHDPLPRQRRLAAPRTAGRASSGRSASRASPPRPRAGSDWRVGRRSPRAAWPSRSGSTRRCPPPTGAGAPRCSTPTSATAAPPGSRSASASTRSRACSSGA